MKKEFCSVCGREVWMSEKRFQGDFDDDLHVSILCSDSVCIDCIYEVLRNLKSITSGPRILKIC